MNSADATDWGSARGQSEVIGYILVFGLVITLLTMATAIGLPAIDSAQADAELDTMDRNFIRLDEEMKSIDSSMSQTTVRVETAPGQLRHGNTTTIITASGPIDGTTQDITFEGAPISYQAETASRQLTYDLGLLARTGSVSGGTQFRAIPDTTTSTTELLTAESGDWEDIRWVLPAVEVADVSYLQGHQTIVYQVEPAPTGTQRVAQFDRSDQIELQVQTVHLRVWKSYLDEHPAFRVEDISSTGGERDEITAEAVHPIRYSVFGQPVRLTQQ